MKRERGLWKKMRSGAMQIGFFAVLLLSCWIFAGKAQAFGESWLVDYGDWIVVEDLKNPGGSRSLTVVGCDNIDLYADGVLEIPSSIKGTPVTGVNGRCFCSYHYPQGTYEEETREEYFYRLSKCENATFLIAEPERVKKLILPDTIEHFSPNSSQGQQVFSAFRNLTEVVLPNRENKEWYDSEQWVCFKYDFERDGYVDLFPALKTATLCGYRQFESFLRVSDGIGEEYTDYRHELETISFHEGVTDVEILGSADSPLQSLKTINLPSSVETFECMYAPSATVNCPKDFKNIAVKGLAGCRNIHVPVYIGASESYWDYTGKFKNSGITEITLAEAAFGDMPDQYWREEFVGCDSLQAINIIESGWNRFHSEEGAMYAEDVLVAYPAAKSKGADFQVPENISGVYQHAFDSCDFNTVTFKENGNSLTGCWEDMDAKIRLVKGSRAAGGRTTAKNVADYLGISDSSRIEFYKGGTYTITYKIGDNARNPVSNPKSYQAGGDIIVLKDPERPGYTFLGWKRNDVKDGYRNDTIPETKFQNYVFTAMWKKKGDKQLKKGTVIKNISGGNYKVTGTGTVEFTKPAKIKATVEIPSTIKKNGVSYKVKSVAANAFKNNKKLTKVVLGGNIQQIGANAFYGCKKLKTVSLNNGLTSIGTKAFYKCTALTQIRLPYSLKSIGKQAFYGCSRLKKIDIWMDKISKGKIGSKAFYGIYKKAAVNIYNNTAKLASIKKILKSKGMPSKAGYKAKIAF